MAPLQTRYASQFMLNVSQGHKSSPGQRSPNHDDRRASKKLDVEVEDSMEQDSLRLRGGPVKNSQVEDDEVDELSPSPEDFKKISRGKPSLVHNPSRIENSQPSLKRVSSEELEEIEDSVNELRQLGASRQHAAPEDEEDELNQDDGGISSPVGTHPKLSQKPPPSAQPPAATAPRATHSKTSHKNATQILPTIKNMNANVKSSAVAALIAKRNQGSQGANKEDSMTEHQSGTQPTATQRKKKKRQSQREDQPAEDERDREVDKQMMSSKTPSRSGGMMAKSPKPVEIRKESETENSRSQRQRTNLPKKAPQGSKAEEAPRATPKAGSLPKVSNLSKRPAKKSISGNAKETKPDELDLPTSPQKKSTKSSKAKGNEPTKATAKAATSKEASNASKAKSKPTNTRKSLSHGMKDYDAEVDAKPSAARSTVQDAETSNGDGKQPKKPRTGISQEHQDLSDSDEIEEDDDNDEDYREKAPAQARSKKTKPSGPARGKKQPKPHQRPKSPDDKPKRGRVSKLVPGASQEEAIILSETEDRQERGGPSSGHFTNDPRTPAVVASSPPGVEQGETRDSNYTDMKTSHKPQVIGFDKTGPRNQGTLSVHDSGKTDKTSRTMKVPLAPEGPSAVPSSLLRSERSTRQAPGPRKFPPSNIADTVGDALTGFSKKPKQSTLATATKDTRTSMASQNEAHDAFGDDDEYTLVDNFEEPTTYGNAIQKDNAPAALHVERTASQLEMPPPRMGKLSTMSSVNGNSLKTHHAAGSQISKGLIGVKRLAQPDPQDQPASKRLKALHGSLKESLTKSASDAMPLHLESMAEKGLRNLQGDPPTVHHGTTLNRRTSSQTVDQNGSPVPKHVFVPENATALETYSLQANLSSDFDFSRLTKASSRARGRNESRSMVDSSALEPVLSNQKTTPASPRKSFEAVSGILPGDIDPDCFVVNTKAASPTTDPFFRTRQDTDAYCKTGNLLTSANECNAKNVLGAEKLRTECPLQDDEDDPDRTLVELEPIKPMYTRKRKLSVCSDSSSDGSVDSDDMDQNLTDIGLWRSYLKPHQMNVFDELINVAHRLVAHLVDRETSANNILEDYRKKGITAIKSLEDERTRRYERYTNDVKAQDKRTREGIAHCTGELRKAQAAMKEKRGKQAKIDAFNPLAKIFEKYC